MADPEAANPEETPATNPEQNPAANPEENPAEGNEENQEKIDGGSKPASSKSIRSNAVIISKKTFSYF